MKQSLSFYVWIAKAHSPAPPHSLQIAGIQSGFPKAGLLDAPGLTLAPWGKFYLQRQLMLNRFANTKIIFHWQIQPMPKTKKELV